MPTLVGIGYFQSVSTRNAGLQLVDLRLCNQARPGARGRGGGGWAGARLDRIDSELAGAGETLGGVG